MTPSARWRRRGKWAGAVASVVIAGVWVVSRWWYVEWEKTIGPSEVRAAGISGGRIYGSCIRFPVVLTGDFGLRSGATRPAPHWLWWFQYANWSSPNGAAGTTYLFIPLWLPFALVAIPTGLLWYRDRRGFGPGACVRCGYDLAGVVGGVCPECGAGKGAG